MMTIFVTFWGQFGMHYALDTCKRSLYCICTQSLLYCNSRDVWEQHSVCWEKAGGWQWGLLRLVPQQTHLSASVSFYWGSPRMASSLRYAASHTSADTHASRKTHKKKCRVTYLKTHCAGLDWARHVDRKWTLGHSVAVFLSGQKWNTHLWKTSVIWCQRFPDTWQKELWSQTNSFQACMIVCLSKVYFGHVKMWSS